jgi:hypothetical protein
VVRRAPALGEGAGNLTQSGEMGTGFFGRLARVYEVAQDQFLPKHGEFGFGKIELVASSFFGVLHLLPTSNGI